MAKLDQIQNEGVSKGNSEDSLLVIYILSILKKYSSPQNPLSSQDVMDRLRDEYSIGSFDKSDAQRKKVRRHLDTLHESFWHGCIKKVEGKTRNGHKWYYDISRDKVAKAEGVVQETLSKEEIDLIIDIIASSKIINSISTNSIIRKLLNKGKHSNEEKRERLLKTENEEWPKSVNKELVLVKQKIQSCINDTRKIVFDYESQKAILATPYGWDSDDSGKYVLIAKIDGQSQGEFGSFLLEKIKNVEKTNFSGLNDFDDTYFDRSYGNPDVLSLESLFGNIRLITAAIQGKKGIEFKYLSYVIRDARVVVVGKSKRVLPHRLVFNEGKYYLIGYDEKRANIDYYRVDMISKLGYSSTNIEISDFDARVLSMVQGAKEVEKHPLMLAGKDVLIIFKVAESALDRVIDAFAVKPDKITVTKETVAVRDSLEEGFHEETLAKVQVRTTEDEAFRWALANADAVELVYPPDLRHKLRRIATPIHKTYAKTMEDKVQANVERVFATGTFKIDQRINEEIANETFKFLNSHDNNDVVNEIKIYAVNADQTDYVGEFTSAKWLDITRSQCVDPKWISKLTELVNIHISMTSISDVSWLSQLNKLKVVRLVQSPITDISVLKKQQNILHLELRNLDIRDISFIENQPRILNLRLIGCPVEDYSPLLRMNPLDYLEIDEKAVAALGMDNLVKHHPDAVIEVQQKIDNRKV